MMSEYIHAGSQVVSGVDGKKVNLNVSCDKDVANLNWNTGGLVVTSVRLAQECVVQGGQNDSTPLSEVKPKDIIIQLIMNLNSVHGVNL